MRFSAALRFSEQSGLITLRKFFSIFAGIMLPACACGEDARSQDGAFPSRMRDDLVVVSTPASPKVAYFLQCRGDSLVLTVQIATFTADGSDTSLDVGLAADKVVRRTGRQGNIQASDHSVLYRIIVPAGELVDNTADWSKLRLGLAVQWAGASGGGPRQREAFQDPVRAPSAALSSNPADWLPIDLDELSRTAADAHKRITFDFNQPMAGKATIVIDDDKGNRIRNLISGQTMAAGPQRITWDGADDNGTAVPPGNYTWRAISHPGLSLHYIMSYVNAPGSNHGVMESAATNGTDIFFGTHVTEGGVENIQLTPDGTLVRGFNAPNGHGLTRNAIAADRQYLFACYDGFSWNATIDRNKPDWKVNAETTLFRFDLKTGELVDFPSARATLLATHEIGPGSADKTPETATALAGIALFNGDLYEADRLSNVLRKIDPATGLVVATFPLPNPVALSANGNGLYAVAGDQLVKLNPDTGYAAPITSLPGDPEGLFAAADGRFFVSDDAPDAQFVRIFDAAGKPLGTLGTACGLKPGPYDPLALKDPAGLVLSPDGHLWVTERDRWTPKRLSAYDLASKTMWKEFFGPTAYGAPGASFDPAHPTHWFGQGTMFDVDLNAGTAKPFSILGGEQGMHYRLWRQDGRTFVIAYGMATYIEELKSDGTLKPLACICDAHHFSFSRKWQPPPAFVDAFQRAYPDQKYVPGTEGRPDHGFGMLWVDKNGDGVMQANEIEFSTGAEKFGGTGWGNDFNDLNLRVPAYVNGHAVMVTLHPQGWWPGGAPRYPSLNDAVKAAVPIDLRIDQVSSETTVDHFGNMLINSDPTMKAYSPDGRLLWTFPNRWAGVQGSHDAPFPQTGELQGVLFYTGVAPLDDQGDVTMMNGNHGRLFAMTTDGMYLDEMFHDVRLMVSSQAGGFGILGGECFGGCFARSEQDGNYYYQGGGIEYRIYRVDGLQRIKRSQGTLTVTPEQAAAAEAVLLHKVAITAPTYEMTVPYYASPPAIDGSESGWKPDPRMSWERVPGSRVEIHAGYDSRMLYLLYSVLDSSPWINNGKDWQMLFKTGDSVDLQLGANPQANPLRSEPVPGDLRLLVAPFQGKNIAVLYRPRLPGATDSVLFQSPWRGEKVDSVEILDSAKIALWHDSDSYRVAVAVPWSALGVEVADQHGFVFDTIQMPLNVMDAHFMSFGQKVLPVVTKKNIGVLGMKPIGARDILKSNTVTAVDCLNFAMNLPVSVCITGCDSMDILKQGLDAARNFQPLTHEQVVAMLSKTEAAAATGEFERYKFATY
jgi:hypothetical protein